MKAFLLFALLFLFSFEAEANPCNITNPYASITNFTSNPDGTCNVTFNITITIVINSGAKWINIIISSPCAYSSSIDITGVYPGGTYTITPWVGITCNNINCASLIANGITADIGLSNSASNAHDQCYSPAQNVPVTVGGILAVKLKNFNVSEQNNKANINWVTSAEEDAKEFVIQRRTNDGSFEDMFTVPSKAIGGKSNVDLSYNVILPEELTGCMYFYRIATISYSDRTIYSDVKSLKGRSARLYLTFSPNPSPGNTILMLPYNAGKVNIYISDVSGKIVQQWTDINTRNLPVTGLNPGTYFVKVQFLAVNTMVTGKLLVIQ